MTTTVATEIATSVIIRMHPSGTELELKSVHIFYLFKHGPNRYTFRSKIQPDAGSPLDANQPIQKRHI